MEKAIAGIDLGSHSIKACIAQIAKDGRFGLLGVDEAPARGIFCGNVIDLADASSVLEELLERMKEKHNVKVFKAVVSVGGLSFSSDLSRAFIVLEDGPRELNNRDIEKVLQIARNMSLSFGSYSLHETIEDYILDGKEGIKNPAGLFARKLELKLISFFYNMANIQNITKCVNYAGIDVEKIVFSGLASLKCFTDEEEAKEGLMLLEIGHQVTRFIVVENGGVKVVKILETGGADITRAISSRFKITLAAAESVKHYSMSGSEGNGISKPELEAVIRKKTEEILGNIKKELENIPAVHNIRTGVIVSGGCAYQEGFLEKAEEVFGMPVRMAVIKETFAKTERPSPLFAPCIGAVEYYAEGIRQKIKGINTRNPFAKLTHRILAFLNDYF